jgi:hypothetical protein
LVGGIHNGGVHHWWVRSTPWWGYSTSLVGKEYIVVKVNHWWVGNTSWWGNSVMSRSTSWWWYIVGGRDTSWWGTSLVGGEYIMVGYITGGREVHHGGKYIIVDGGYSALSGVGYIGDIQHQIIWILEYVI